MKKKQYIFTILFLLSILVGCTWFFNELPVADAGEFQIVTVGDVVLLNGSGSSSYWDKSVDYSWDILYGPIGYDLEELVISNSTSPSASFIVPEAGDYYIQLTVEDSRGVSSDEVIIRAYDTPVLPESINFYDITESTISVSWSEVKGASEYSLYRADSDLTQFSDDDLIYRGKGLSYTDCGLQQDQTYYYKMQLQNPIGITSLADCQVMPAATLLLPPDKPENVLIQGDSSTSLRISWDTVEYATSYKVYRDTDVAGLFTDLIFDDSETSCVDTGLQEQTTYYYKIKALNRVGESPFSSMVSGTPFFQLTTPPSNFRIIDIGFSSIDLSWDAVANANEYKLMRSENGITFSICYSGSGTTFKDTGLESGTTYYYKVYAQNNYSTSETSSEISTSTKIMPESTGDAWIRGGQDYLCTFHLEEGSKVQTSSSLITSELMTIANTNILAGDIDGDDDQEIVYAADGKVYIYDPSGVLERLFSIPVSEPFISLLADIDDDGVLDIGIGSSNADPMKAYFYSGSGIQMKEFTNTHRGTGDGVLIFPTAVYNGSVLMGLAAGSPRIPRGLSSFDLISEVENWYYQVGPATWTEISIADFDADENLEFILGSITTHNGASGNGTTDDDNYIMIVDEDGNNDLTQMHDANSNGFVKQVFTDLDHDQQYEILAFRNYDSSSYFGDTRIQKFNTSGTLIDEFDSGLDNKEWTFSIVNIVGDNDDEIVGMCETAIFILDSNLNLLLQKSFYGLLQCTADLNGDGNIEVVIYNDSTGILSVLNDELILIDSLDIGRKSNGKVIAADIDNDAVVELISSTDKLRIVEFNRIPDTPEGVRIVFQNEGSVTIACDEQDIADTYSFYKSVSVSGPFSTLVYSGDQWQCSETNLDPGTVIYYAAQASNSYGSSDLSSPIQVLIDLLAPSNLQIIEIDSESVSLEWDTSINATGYRLYRSQDGGDFAVCYDGGQSWYVDNAVSAGSNYTYKVLAYNSYVTSAESSSVNASPEIVLIDDPGWVRVGQDYLTTFYQEAGSKILTSDVLNESILKTDTTALDILAGDVDGDGFDEIIYTQDGDVYIFSASGVLKRTIHTPYECVIIKLLADIDGDSTLDIGLGTRDAEPMTVVFYDGNGNLLNSFVNTHRGAGASVYIWPEAVIGTNILMSLDSGFPKIPRGFSSFAIGTQQENWYYQVGPIQGTPGVSIADIDADGDYDFTRHSGTVHNGATGNDTTDGDSYLVIVDESGNNVLTQMHDWNSNGQVRHTFSDLDHDGAYEVLAFRGYDPQYYQGDSRIQKFNAAGTLIDEYDSGIDNRKWAFSIVDLDDNGTDEIIASCELKTIILDSELNQIDEVLISGMVQCTSDLNGDGHIEIVLLDDNTGLLSILDDTLNTITSKNIGQKSSGHGYTQVIASDIDNDDVVELISITDSLRVLEFKIGPDAPANVDIRSTMTTVALVWEGSQEGVDYKIYRDSQENGDYETQVYSGQESFYIDETLVAGSSYYYKIEVIDGSGNSAITDAFRISTKTKSQVKIALINPDYKRILKAGVFLSEPSYSDREYWIKTAGMIELADSCDKSDPSNWTGYGEQSDFVSDQLIQEGYTVDLYTADEFISIDEGLYDLIIIQDPLNENFSVGSWEHYMVNPLPDLIENVSTGFINQINDFIDEDGRVMFVGDALKLLEDGDSLRLNRGKSISDYSPSNVQSNPNDQLPGKWLFIRGNPFCGYNRNGSSTYTIRTSSLLPSSTPLSSQRLFNGNDLPESVIWSDTFYRPSDAISLADINISGSGDYVLTGSTCNPPVYHVTVNDNISKFAGYTTISNRKYYYLSSDSFFDFLYIDRNGAWHSGEALEMQNTILDGGKLLLSRLVYSAIEEYYE